MSLIRITSRVDLAMSLSSVRMNGEILETNHITMKLSRQVLKLPAQRKFVSKNNDNAHNVQT